MHLNPKQKLLLTVCVLIGVAIALYYSGFVTTNHLFTGLVFFLVLSVLVLIHEFGHFLVARAIGVKVEEFGFGLPPKIFGKKFAFAQNEWSLNWLPIGG